MSSERQAFNDGFDKGYTKSLDKIALLEQRIEELEGLLGRAAEYIERSNSDDLGDLVRLPPVKDTVKLLRQAALAQQEEV